MIAALYETDTHAALREQARRFARTHIRPHAHAWDEAEEFPRERLVKSDLLKRRLLSWV
jgi:alkylation response protein AidB-like acyl-CoA dehydrogenase